MTSQVADTQLRTATVGCRGQHWPRLAADPPIGLSASPASLAIHERLRAVLTSAHAIDLEV
jgi:hypothetical protein